MYLCDRGTIPGKLLVMYLCVSGHVFVCYWSCICVIGVSILSLYTNLIFYFETLPTVWYYEVFMLLLKFVFFSEYIQQNR
jgi:hypothetical protein